MISFEFLIVSLIVILIPGTGVIFTVSTGITQGRKASIYAALGCTAGIVPHLLATILGLAAIMHTSAIAFQTFKYAGVAYLLYVAYATWQDRSAFSLEETPSRSSARALIVKALLLNILNPKLTIFFLAFLPQFVEPNASNPLRNDNLKLTTCDNRILTTPSVGRKPGNRGSPRENFNTSQPTESAPMNLVQG